MKKRHVCSRETHFLGTVFWTLKRDFKLLVRACLTVATILLTAAAESSSPLGCSTIVTPRYLSWNDMPSSRVSLVSVQFSGSSATWDTHHWHFCSPPLLAVCTAGCKSPRQTCHHSLQAGRTCPYHGSVHPPFTMVRLCSCMEYITLATLKTVSST